MARVLVTDHVFPDLNVERNIIGGAGHDLVYEGQLATGQELLAAARDVAALMTCYAGLTRDLLARLHRCRIISCYGVGVDNVDLKAAKELGIIVTNVPDYCLEEVSTHTIALLLALHRRIVVLTESVRAGEWNAVQAQPIHRLSGMVVGLIGFGNIARAVARKAQGLGLRIVATDPVVERSEMAALGVSKVDIEPLLLTSDFISLHAPLTEGSRHLLSDQEFQLMRPHAVLINTARGGLVDTYALWSSLRNGSIGGAGLDVLEEEPPGKEWREMASHPSVILTPHCAFYSEESLSQLRKTAAQQVVDALAGETPEHVVA